MKIYLVGGAVRDKLLGIPVKERDYVVVGSTIPEMLSLGYRQVGKEFPVFLHPKTKEEYALARKERKIKPGYTGFTFDTSPLVTLSEDLERRDLTINAMAETENGELVDPYHGQEDLQNKILRHVSNAFSEDPVRILRVGRFLARYEHLGFKIAPETLTLMQKMVASGEVDALIAERVFKELERALGEKNPEKFFEVLHLCGALPILFPHFPIDGLGMEALRRVTSITNNPLIRFAVLSIGYSEKQAFLQLCHRYRVPNQYRDLALLVMLHYQEVLSSQTLSTDQLLKLLSKIDVFRREKRFNDFLIAVSAIAHVNDTDFNPEWLKSAAKIAKSVNIQDILASGFQGKELLTKIIEKRKQALDHWRKI